MTMLSLVAILSVMATLGLSSAQTLSPAMFIEATRMARIRGPNADKTAGPAIADLNQDGFLDIVQTNHARRPVNVYYGQATGRFSRVDFFANKSDRHAVSIGDYNNDGLPDMALVNGGILDITEPDGNRYGIPRVPPVLGRTRSQTIGDVEEIPGAEIGMPSDPTFGLTSRFGGRWLDVDNDGDLDIFFLGFNNKNPERYNDTRHQHIFKNLGNGAFEYATGTNVEFALDMGFLVTDYNTDGYPDLITYNKGVQIFRNNQDFTFQEVTDEVFPDRYSRVQFSSAAEIDYDNDGDFDLYFGGGMKLKRSAREGSDVFLENNGDGTFSDISRRAGVPKRGTHMGITVGDFDNNGFMDIFLPRAGPVDERISDLILFNDRGRTFEVVESHGANGPLDGSDDTSAVGAQAFDYDKDGLLDVAVTTRNHPVGGFRLFKNITPIPGRYLLVKVPVVLEGRSTMDAIVRVILPRRTLTRRVGSAGEARVQSFIDQVHFGLGSATRISLVTLTLTNGETRSIRRPSVDSMVEF